MSRIPAQHTSSAVPRSALAVAREAGLAHHSLVDKQPAEPQAFRGGESSGPNGNGKGLVNGGTDGTTDGTSSAGDDDDDESDEADEEDSEKTDVTCPPRATPSMSDSQSSAAGPLKRTFDEAGLGKEFMIDGLDFDISSAQDDDDVVFPRKKIKKRISATDQGILAYNEEKTEDEGDEEEDGGLTCDDDDDGNITDFEEEALVREFENDEELLREIGIIDTPIAAPAAQIDLFDPALLQDLDNEIFDAMCNNPHRFDDLQDLQDLQSPFDWNPFVAESEGDLFPAHPTPGVSPDATPRASISEQGRIIQSSASSPSGENESDESSEDEVANLSPFFEMNNATLKHLVSTEGKGAWGEGTDDDDADLVKYFFSSSSSVESDSGEATDDEETDDDEEEQTVDGGETTDEEEDLPMPTPRHASKLRRASVSSTTAVRPQIIDTNNDGPELRSWVADPSRPICVIEGTKQTFLIPEAYKFSSVSGRTGSTSSEQWIPLEAESESEQSTAPMQFDPTLTGLTGIEGGALSGSDILGPPEAFYPFMSDGPDVFSDLFNEEDYDVDEFETGLQIGDFLDLSSAEDGTSEGGNGAADGLSDDCAEGGEEDEEECVPNPDTNADMLSIWDKVSVTAFRKRQFQHSQKQFHANQYGAAGYHKGKEGRLSETITPTKKRRVRQKFLANNRGMVGNNPATTKKKVAR